MPRFRNNVFKKRVHYLKKKKNDEQNIENISNLEVTECVRQYSRPSSSYLHHSMLQLMTILMKL